MFPINNRVYSFIALLFVFLTLMGYPLVTSLFLPAFSDEELISQSVTYPFRALVLLLAVSLIVFKPIIKQSITNRKWANLFIAFILIYIIRILFDIYVVKIYVIPFFRLRVIQHFFLAVIPSLWAISRSAQYIDYNRLNKWLLYGGILLLIIISINEPSLIQAEFDESERMVGNVGLGSISLGQLGVTVFLTTIAWMLTYRNKTIYKPILLIILLVSSVVMLRAASRGPLVTFIVMIMIILMSTINNKVLAIALSVIASAFLFINIEGVLHFLGQISPVMEQRMLSTVNEGNTSYRDILYANAFSVFLRHPIIGSQFVTDFGFYSHNTVLDVLMSLGILGGLVWIVVIIKVFIVTFKKVEYHSCLSTICLLSFQNIFAGFFSGTLYDDHIQIILIAMVLLLQNESIDCINSDSNPIPEFKPN